MAGTAVRGREPARGANASWDRLLRVTEIVLASWAGALGALGLAGWIFDVPELTRVTPSLAVMPVNTALSLLLLAVARILPGRLAALAGGAATVITAVTLLEYVIDRDLGLDQVLHSQAGADPDPGRPALTTALCVIALVACWQSPLRRFPRVAQGVELVVLGVAALVVLGCLFGVPSLYSLSPFGSVAVHTATALLLLTLAGLVRIERGIGVLPWLLLSSRPGATLMRIAVPTAVLGIPVAGYLCQLAAQHGLGADAVVAMLVLLCMAALLLSAWASGVRLDGVDRRRRQALADLHALNAGLEVEVENRTAEVYRGRDELVLLAERQRIAADLHDVVVQRLFAAGMLLSTTDPGGDTATVGRNVNDAVDAMDTAIRELRTSIFELNTPTTTGDLEHALAELCVESSRVLGYPPELTLDDPDREAGALAPDVLAVAREGLANVGRHAQATSASLSVSTREGWVTVEVVDNGVGLRAGGHRSGTRNMRGRADRLGGTCEWTPVAPHGTRLVWRVPSPTSRSRAGSTVPVPG